MTAQPTLSTLQLDCLLSILSYIPLPECLPLRMTCHYLKAAVEEYFRDSVRVLPVMLSARYMSKDVAEYNRRYGNYGNWEKSFTEYEEVVFGSGTSQWRSWEDKHIFRCLKSHFRRCDYLVLWDIPKFDSLVSFIAQYFPNITKLALILDHEALVFNIPKVLKIYRKQLKELVLEMTVRGTRSKRRIWSNLRLVDESITYPEFDKLPLDIYHSIDALETLEELYFFAKNSTTFWLEGEEEHQFFDRMLCRLRVLHINCFCKRVHGNGGLADVLVDRRSIPADDLFWPRIYSKLEELACNSFKCLYNQNEHHRFPNLEKCILLERIYVNYNHLEDIDVNFMPNLRELRFELVNFTPEWLQTLHTFPKLEKIYCNRLMIFMRYVDVEQLRQIKQNRTVKFIEADKLIIPYERNRRQEEDIAQGVAIFSRAFQKSSSFKWNIFTRSM